MKNPLKNTPWAPRTIMRMKRPGFASFIKVRRCIRSLYASSRRVSILSKHELASCSVGCNGLHYHPLSLFIRRRLLRCLNIPPTMPGTPATLSKKMNRVSHFLSVILNLGSASWPGLGCRYPVTVSIPHRSIRTVPSASQSAQSLASRWET